MSNMSRKIFVSCIATTIYIVLPLISKLQATDCLTFKLYMKNKEGRHTPPMINNWSKFSLKM